MWEILKLIIVGLFLHSLANIVSVKGKGAPYEGVKCPECLPLPSLQTNLHVFFLIISQAQSSKGGDSVATACEWVRFTRRCSAATTSTAAAHMTVSIDRFQIATTLWFIVLFSFDISFFFLLLHNEIETWFEWNYKDFVFLFLIAA